jgi:lipoic acid synthetase
MTRCDPHPEWGSDSSAVWRQRMSASTSPRARVNEQLLQDIDLQFPLAAESGPWPTEVHLYTQDHCADVLERRDRAAALIRHSQAPGHHMQILEHGPTWCLGRDMEPLKPSGQQRDLMNNMAIEICHTGKPGCFEYLGPGILMVYMVHDPGHTPPGSFSLFTELVCKLVPATLADFEISCNIQPSSNGDFSFMADGKLIAAVRVESTGQLATTRIQIHTNTDIPGMKRMHRQVESGLRDLSPAGPAQAGPDPELFMTTMVEHGMPVHRQDSVRISLMHHYEKLMQSKLLIPQGGTQHETKPPWLKAKLPYSTSTRRTHEIIGKHQLNTVCEGAHCPNMGECWSHGTATFMINGDVCTRSCSFCAIYTGRPEKMDPDESKRVAEAAALMNLRYVVVTAVNRDELPDGGAAQFAATIRELRKAIPSVRVEVLIPDFKGDGPALDVVFSEKPDVLNHNMETVPRLYRRVRPQARYQRSLDVIRRAGEAGLMTKSGFMVGLGETEEEVRRLLRDQHDHGCHIVTIGQYLRPSARHHPVVRYVSPSEFEGWKDYGLSLGFRTVESAPLVRSSYHAFDSYRDSMQSSTP